MRLPLKAVSCFLFSLLVACSPVKVPVVNQYQLTKYSTRHFMKARKKISILVALPEAVAGYKTEQMLYMIKPFKLSAFAHNAWVSPPADMIYPLILQSLQHSNYFYAVASSPYAEQADYRLDTQLLKLHQNFLQRPSVIELSVKVVLTDITNGQVIASRIINQRVCSPMESPYGGVLAANKATEAMTAAIAEFVIKYTGGSHFKSGRPTYK
ncbi:hypothetical protein E3983_03975 [Legionella israelensis]|uniref:Transport protein n=1 Tax=Legionella israelensis TaxID=454 RepID=A0A0W0WNF0_9GAMM|nr:ABC-type transport auxiliary lipoprotein family protein [Legionella israelensis]KTD33858.1 transport protein [Legionella israelensis]QBR83585.1 hypothetical protein E3983_03975 [Legionella israelensis]QBS08974.1 hypothetical protein E4T55_03315 [Legionella israelensis]SCX81293.1 cholesterol transport system auxiliary component [Legionella israelensis DSM 19235]STX58667.1 ABC transporter auxiliary component [Legionella israelensis]